MRNLNPFRHRRDDPHIQLRISTRNGVVVATDCEALALIVKYSGTRPGEWYNLVAGGDCGGATGEFSVVPIKIEVRHA